MTPETLMSTIVIVSVVCVSITIIWAFFFTDKKEKRTTKTSQTKCADCGAYIDKINPVSVDDLYERAYENSGIEFNLYHCNDHKKPYTKMVVPRDGRYRYYRTEDLEVEKDGSPVGYVSREEHVFEMKGWKDKFDDMQKSITTKKK